MIDELKLIDNIDVLFDNKIVLYGAGLIGVKAVKMLKEAGMPAAAYFCDGDPRKWGTFVEGVEVLLPSELKQLDESEKLAIIIASEQMRFIDQIAEDIAWLKLRTDNIFTVFGLNVALSRNNKLSGLNGGHYNAVLNMRRDIFYASWSAYHLEIFASWIEKSNVFLVYSLPKAGTSTIRRSLQEINVFADHFHRLIYNPFPFLEELSLKHRQSILNILRSRKSVKIISMVREPVSRIISNIFHIAERNDVAFSEMQPGKPFVDLLMETVISRKWIISELDPMYESLNWFDNELKTVFGIDVYAHPFDREEGYSIIKQDNIEVLVMKLEKLNSLEQIIAEFVGALRFKLINNNEADNKLYKYLYRQVKKAIKIPRRVFDSYYEDPRIRHFYHDEEIAGFLKKWEKNIAD